MLLLNTFKKPSVSSFNYWQKLTTRVLGVRHNTSTSSGAARRLKFFITTSWLSYFKGKLSTKFLYMSIYKCIYATIETYPADSEDSNDVKLPHANPSDLMVVNAARCSTKHLFFFFFSLFQNVKIQFTSKVSWLLQLLNVHYMSLKGLPSHIFYFFSEWFTAWY